ncbi:MAG: hypothetical protein HDS84_07315 [Bacteroidales bacterium]|nr:hypothetical protein [Bacteroidales bacterium]
MVYKFIQTRFFKFIQTWHATSIHLSGNVTAQYSPVQGRTYVGTWRATSECCGDLLRMVLPQTWRATYLHLSGIIYDVYSDVARHEI